LNKLKDESRALSMPLVLALPDLPNIPVAFDVQTTSGNDDSIETDLERMSALLKTLETMSISARSELEDFKSRVRDIETSISCEHVTAEKRRSENAQLIKEIDAVQAALDAHSQQKRNAAQKRSDFQRECKASVELFRKQTKERLRELQEEQQRFKCEKVNEHLQKKAALVMNGKDGFAAVY
jgi:chromosome segregation ATPase